MAKRAYHHGDLRSAMLVASELILDRDGLDALTLRAAAREAGVSHAAPVHHFGDLSGLLSALAASGFSRFRAHLLAAVEARGDGRARQAVLCVAYVDFARTCPGLFQLMFRSSRLDWTRHDLIEAAEAAFLLLTHGQGDDDAGSAGRIPLGPDRFASALSRWSMAHGLAMLSLDGRLDALAAKEGADPVATVSAVADLLPCGF